MPQHQALNLPPYPFKLQLKDGQYFIFDELRKKHLLLTPEEWVRQHFIQFLILRKKCPKTLIRLEGGLSLNSLQKRSDILLYNQEGKALLLVECKAASVKITQAVFDQAARYNTVHQAPWLVVTNGLEHYYAYIDHHKKSFHFIEELPEFAELQIKSP